MLAVLSKPIPARLTRALGQWTDEIVGHLFDMVSARFDAVVDPRHNKSFCEALDTVQGWDHERRERVLDPLYLTFPSMRRDYEYTYYKCIAIMVPGFRSTRPVTIPVCTDFAFMFLVKCIQDPGLRAGGGTHKARIAIMENAFRTCIATVSMPSMKSPIEQNNSRPKQKSLLTTENMRLRDIEQFQAKAREPTEVHKQFQVAQQAVQEEPREEPKHFQAEEEEEEEEEEEDDEVPEEPPSSPSSSPSDQWEHMDLNTVPRLSEWEEVNWTDRLGNLSLPPSPMQTQMYSQM